MYIDIPGKINNFDKYILSTIKKYLGSKYLDILMPLITSMGNLGAIWIIIAVSLSFTRSFGKIGEVVILTLIVSTIIGEGIIKHIVKRIRPCNLEIINNLLISKPLSYSFPSGHTLSSFAAAEVLSTYFVQYKILFMTIASLIALSRLYLCVHYPTDVVAGIIFSLICSRLVLIIIEKGYVQRLEALCKIIL